MLKDRSCIFKRGDRGITGWGGGEQAGDEVGERERWGAMAAIDGEDEDVDEDGVHDVRELTKRKPFYWSSLPAKA